MGDAPRGILSPLREFRKAKSSNDLRDERPIVAAQGQRAARKPPPDLAAVMAAWDALPEPIRMGILAMVRASKGDDR
jgi:hypothetical protein